MPALTHLQARFLEDSSGSGGITTTAIALIIVLGVLPCIVLVWAVCYLFWAYPYDRNWCCMKRKRRADKPGLMDQAAMSEAVLYEKPALAPPQRPFSAQTRTESGSSSGTGRLQKAQRPNSGASRMDTRMSLASVGSANTMPISHEPKPFV
ncbi:hypothetical protein BDW02DRAFT_488028 [Decorospora gaudefroyi]|uniref:Uncharacterized protein n=1 Tax=Decorospora gaudefroyi TaxID=184978 RepID=A0A6A5KVF4_9PLEO|nr:hypothetical protein BDW02DRAFT_488028 [Decorospora gaudefroyi]